MLRLSLWKRRIYSSYKNTFGTRFYSLRQGIDSLAKYYKYSGYEDGSVVYSTIHARWLWEHARGNVSSFKRSIDSITKDHKPLAYVLGTQDFYPLEKPLIVRPPCLIPRSETEGWIADLIELVKEKLASSPFDRKFRILEVGSGTGCIALALTAGLFKHCAISVVSIDVDEAALTLSRENLKQFADFNHLVEFTRADIFDDGFINANREKYDMIVSNPPYLSNDELSDLDNSVRLWESPMALVGNPLYQDKLGLGYYKRILEVSDILLSNSHTNGLPKVVLEAGCSQASLITSLTIRSCQIIPDMSGIDRVVYVF